MTYQYLQRGISSVLKHLVVGSAVIVAVVLPTLAQDNKPSEPEQLKPVVVTGSLIPTAETVGPTPVAVVSAVELEKRDVKSPEQLSKILPSAIGGGNFGSSRGNGGDGSAAIALRGIPGGTLVLLNSRRLAPNSFNDGGQVDINTIPLAAVDRVEILKDGGSAIYGADAVAGVVNFILKKNYNGTEFGAYYGNTSETDMTTQNYYFVTGSADEKSNFLLGGSYYKQNALYSKDRDRSRADISNPGNTSGTSNPGGFNVPNNLRGDSNLYNPSAAPTASVRVRINDNAVPDGYGRFTPDDYRLFNNNDRFPYPNYTPAIRPSERYYAFANGERQLVGDVIKFFAEANYSHTWSYNQLAPTPFNSAFSPVTIPANNFYNPFYVPITSWAYRTVELGPRTENTDADTFRIVTGIRGEIPDTTLKWETAFLYGRDRRTQILGGDFSFNAASALLQSTGPDALNIFGRQSISPSALNAISEPLYTVTDAQMVSWDFTLNGELFNLPSGPVGFAAGSSFNHETLDQQPDYPQRSGDLVGFNATAPLQGTRDIWSFFGEVSVPFVSPEKDITMLHSLEVSGAFRYDNYSDFGDTWNPKVTLRWQPIDKSLTIRGSYSTSFRAPTFQDLYQQPSEDFPELRNPVVYNDPNRGPNDPYAFTQIRTLRVGNPDLEPETAKNWTAGFVYSPNFIEHLTLSVDWYRITQENVPASVDQYILDQNYAGGGPFNPNAPFANLIVADPNSPEIYQLLTAPTLNLSKRLIEGFDVTMRYDVPTEKFGTFSFIPDVAYVYKFEQEDIPGQGLHDRLGDFVDPSQGFGLGTIPRLKFNVALLWAIKDFEFGATVYYIRGYLDDTAALGYRHEVESMTTLDLQASYTFRNCKYAWMNETKFTAGVNNVADTEPPQVDAAFADNYDRDTHDLKGRFYYVSISKKF